MEVEYDFCLLTWKEVEININKALNSEILRKLQVCSRNLYSWFEVFQLMFTLARLLIHEFPKLLLKDMDSVIHLAIIYLDNLLRIKEKLESKTGDTLGRLPVSRRADTETTIHTHTCTYGWCDDMMKTHVGMWRACYFAKRIRLQKRLAAKHCQINLIVILLDKWGPLFLNYHTMFCPRWLYHTKLSKNIIDTDISLSFFTLFHFQAEKLN